MGAPRKGEPDGMGREVEDQLHLLTKRFEQVLEISPTAIVFTDLDNRVASWNPAAVRLFGYSAEEAAGRDLDDLVAGTDALHVEAVEFRQRVAASEHVRTISRRTRQDGSFVDVELLAAPLVVDGEPVGTFAIYHDITELNRQKRFLEALLEVSPEAIVTTDLDDTVTSWNPSAERLFGYAADEAIGHDIDELVSRREDLYAEGKQLNRGALDSPMAHLVTQRTRKDGSLVDVDIVGGPVTVGGELVAKHVFYHDISELQEQKRYFESLLEISPTAIVITDLDSKIVSWNPAAERLFGYSAEEAVGRGLDDLVRHRPELHEEAVAYTRGRGTWRAGPGDHPADPEGRIPRGRRGPHRPVTSAKARSRSACIRHLPRHHRGPAAEALARVRPEHQPDRDHHARRRDERHVVEPRSGTPLRLQRGRGDRSGHRRSRRDDARAAGGVRSARCRGATGGRGVRVITRRTRKDGSLVDVELLTAPVADRRRAGRAQRHLPRHRRDPASEALLRGARAVEPQRDRL